jgi:hypothetical protein
MNYRVVWRARSFHLLSQLHFTLLEMDGDVAGFERAWDDIELRLAGNPTEEGESRDGNERVLIVNPLTVVFEVFPDQGVVIICRLVHHRFRAANG